MYAFTFRRNNRAVLIFRFDDPDAAVKLFQSKGINIGSWTQNASILIQETVRARVTSTSYYLGFIPGFCATLLGTSLSGIGIYKRQTSELAKEMES